MNNHQENDLSMAVTTQQFLRDNPDVVKSIVAFEKAAGVLDDNIAAIKGYAQAQLRYSTGTKRDKDNAERSAVEKAVELANGGRAYASSMNNQELYDLLNITEPQLLRMRDSDTVDKLHVIADTLTGLPKEVADYGVNTDETDELGARIKALEVIEQAPRKNISVRAAATSALEKAFIALKKGLDEMDGIVGTLKSKQPLFYTAYQTARTVVDNRGGGGKDKGEAGAAQ